MGFRQHVNERRLGGILVMVGYLVLDITQGAALSFIKNLVVNAYVGIHK